jgi:PQQ-dependent dehydrogenase (methanol/ethanol family)
MIKGTASAVALMAGCGFATSALANDDVMALVAAGNVVMPSITYNGWNYSPFDQITTDNVANLTLDWTMQMGVLDQWEASPLVVGDTMYVVSPVNQSDGTGQAPNTMLAIDLNTQTIIWEFRPDVDREAALQACCGAQTRGLQYAEGKIFYHTLDGQVFALDGLTGEALWRSIGADVTIREHTPGNGLIAGDLYIIGNAGGEYGVRGKVQAFDIADGQTQWVMYNMGPNNEVGIGPRFNPFYADDQQGSLNTWWGDSWRRGGGTVWGYFTFDPDRNQFFYSTGNCGPWNPDYRREWGVVTLDENGGLIDYRNNWCASTMSRDATTGELIWAYNNTPADNWDIDEPLINPLIQVEVGGVTRDAVVRAARNGYFYLWDRDDGELLAEPWPFVYVDFMTGVDMATGRAMYDITRWSFTNVEDRRRYTDYDMPGAAERDDYTGTEVDMCPGYSARNWQNDAYSPVTGLLYTSVNTDCQTHAMVEGEYVAGEGYTLRRNTANYPGGVYRVPDRTDPNYGQPTDIVAQLQANDPQNSRTVWTVDRTVTNTQGYRDFTPVMATAGGLLFQGASYSGEMRAYDAATGDQLWAFGIGSEVHQSAVSYIGPDGRQYIAFIASSPGTDAVVFEADADNPNRYRRAGSTLFVFALPAAVAGGM